MKKSEIIELIEKLDDSSLAEMYIKDGEFELNLKKAGAVVQQFAAPTTAVQANESGVPQAVPSAVPAQNTPEDGSENREDGYEIITAPIVGTFYRSPSPDSPPYVDEESEVKQGDTLCIIEAMKVMNELEAEFDCRIKRVLVENQQMIEYGAPLFEVEKL